MLSVPAVSSPAQVTYRCSEPQEGWSPGTFNFKLVASAGRPGCSGQGSGTAVLRVIDKPTVLVAAPITPVVLCESLESTFVDVTFPAATDSGVPVKLPPLIEASDGRTCYLENAIGEWCAAAVVCARLQLAATLRIDTGWTT